MGPTRKTPAAFGTAGVKIGEDKISILLRSHLERNQPSLADGTHKKDPSQADRAGVSPQE